MTTFKCIIGLPGSGKTTLAKKWLSEMDEYSLAHSVLFDDLCLNFDYAVNTFDKDLHHTVIITDPKMCNSSEDKIKDVLKKNFICDDYNFEFHYFENDPEACTINATRDPKPGGTTNFIRMYCKMYFIPPNSIIHPVYKDNL